MKRKLIIILFIGAIIQSCMSNKYLKSDIYTSGNSKIGYFEPSATLYVVDSASIILIGSKLKHEFNDTLSKQLKYKIDSVIDKNKATYQINNKIIIKSNSIAIKVKQELAYLSYQSMTKLSLKGIKLTPTIDSILESKNQRFAIGISALGFQYKKEKISQKIKSELTAILTFGFASPPPIKNQLSFSSIIMDSKYDKIIFATNTTPTYRFPLDSNIIKKQLDQLFKDYTYKD